MTFLEACTLIDKELDELGAKDIFGKVHTGIMVMPYVYKILGDEIDKPQVALQNGEISIEKYAEDMVALIRRCASVTQARKIEEKLSNLFLDQVELDLTKGQLREKERPTFQNMPDTEMGISE
jgi:hypothetical protein